MQFDESKRRHERACRVTPGGVHSNVRLGAYPGPTHYTRAEGVRMWDADGNELIDYVLGQGPMFMGHTPEPVIEAVKRQAEKGLLFAGQSEDEVVAAELLVEHIPCAEKVRFSTTGSEAVHGALRLARAMTGRKKVLRFEGHYHGWLDTIAWNPATPDTNFGPRENPPLRPASKGQQPEDGANLIICPWNDVDSLSLAFERSGDELAAVICDPFASAAGLIPALPEFLTTLRELCTKHRTVLIFDEVITGIRLPGGSAQAYYGVTPDLATFAKALGAGMPVSAIVGRADLMDGFTQGVVHAGTYNANQLAMAGTRAALMCMFADDGAEMKKAHDAGQWLCDGLKSLASDAGLPLQILGVPSVFSTSFVPPEAEPIVDCRTARQADTDLQRQFWTGLHDRGIQFTGFGIWFVSTAHTDVDIDQTLDAAAAWFKEV
jgi:glutamate-1-semialdehyde 2,1-aminomutase